MLQLFGIGKIGSGSKILYTLQPVYTCPSLFGINDPQLLRFDSLQYDDDLMLMVVT